MRRGRGGAYMIGGFDIGGTKCAALIGEDKGSDLEIFDRREFKTEGTPYEVIAKLISVLKQELSDKSKTEKDLTAIGVSCGGPLDGKRGIIMSPPNLPGWDNIRITEIIRKELGVKAYLCNDADASAIAEWKYGAGKGSENMVFLTFGTGLGAGLILNGKLYVGANNFAGEAGHIRLDNQGPCGYGKIGSFEGFCSGGGIARLAKNRVLEILQKGEKPDFCASVSELANITAKSLFGAAENGSKLAKDIFAEVGDYFGLGLSYIIDLLNPERIIVGGVYMRAHKYIEKSMRARIKKECLSVPAKVKVLPAGLGEKIGDYAALSIAANANNR